MPITRNQPLNIFIIRFWRETTHGHPFWRGEIQHIPSGERAAFMDEESLVAFLRRWVHMPTGKEDDIPE